MSHCLPGATAEQEALAAKVARMLSGSIDQQNVGISHKLRFEVGYNPLLDGPEGGPELPPSSPGAPPAPGSPSFVRRPGSGSPGVAWTGARGSAAGRVATSGKHSLRPPVADSVKPSNSDLAISAAAAWGTQSSKSPSKLKNALVSASPPKARERMLKRQGTVTARVALSAEEIIKKQAAALSTRCQP